MLENRAYLSNSVPALEVFVAQVFAHPIARRPSPMIPPENHREQEHQKQPEDDRGAGEPERSDEQCGPDRHRVRRVARSFRDFVLLRYPQASA